MIHTPPKQNGRPERSLPLERAGKKETSYREIQAAGTEYMDLLYFGIPAGLAAAAGFVSSADHEGLVLPNHFEPFEQWNMRIEIAYRVAPAFAGYTLRLFRGDSDQDRPNQPQSLQGRNQLP